MELNHLLDPFFLAQFAAPNSSSSNQEASLESMTPSGPPGTHFELAEQPAHTDRMAPSPELVHRSYGNCKWKMHGLHNHNSILHYDMSYYKERHRMLNEFRENGDKSGELLQLIGQSAAMAALKREQLRIGEKNLNELRNNFKDWTRDNLIQIVMSGVLDEPDVMKNWSRYADFGEVVTTNDEVAETKLEEATTSEPVFKVPYPPKRKSSALLDLSPPAKKCCSTYPDGIRKDEHVHVITCKDTFEHQCMPPPRDTSRQARKPVPMETPAIQFDIPGPSEMANHPEFNGFDPLLLAEFIGSNPQVLGDRGRELMEN